MANICCETLSSKKVIKCLGFLPVLFCLSLLGWSYYAFMFTLCIPVLLKHLPVMGWTMLALVQPAFILAIWSYLGAVFINPGIPRQEGKSEETAADWQIAQAAARAEEEEDEEGQNVGDSTPLRGTSPVKPLEDRPTDGNLFPTITVKRDGSARYCKKCQFYKPDRTHHCRVCQECVLKMDHHCPWINGCVGHYNQKHFYLFLFWTCVYCVMNFVSVMPPLYKSLHDQSKAEYTADIQWLFLALASGMFGFSLIGFMSFHTWLLLKNMTTIESFGRQRLRSEMGSDQRHVFDLGFRKNIEQVLGPDPRLWLLPVRSTPGNGLRYPTCVPQDMAMEEGRTCSV